MFELFILVEFSLKEHSVIITLSKFATAQTAIADNTCKRCLATVVYRNINRTMKKNNGFVQQTAIAMKK